MRGLARAINPTHRGPRRLPRQQQPDALRAGYLDALRRMVLAPARAAVKRHVLDRWRSLTVGLVRQDAAHTDAVDDISLAVQAAKQDFAQDVPEPRMRWLARKYGRDTDYFQAQQLNRQVRTAIGVDVVSAPPQMAQRLEEFAAENVALIKSIPEEYFSRVEKTVLRAARTGERAEDVAAQLQKDYDVSESRAQLIARDQIGKFYADLQEARQRDLGVDAYIWRTMQDERVRDTHEAHEGKRYLWSQPPAGTGHPGEDYQCRCYAEPDLSAVLGQLA